VIRGERLIEKKKKVKKKKSQSKKKDSKKKRQGEKKRTNQISKELIPLFICLGTVHDLLLILGT
jgi:hypothetical protein